LNSRSAARHLSKRLSCPCLLAYGFDLSQHLHHFAANVGIHRERVDHVGPPASIGIALAQEVGGDRVTVELVEGQDAAQLVPCRG